MPGSASRSAVKTMSSCMTPVGTGTTTSSTRFFLSTEYHRTGRRQTTRSLVCPRQETLTWQKASSFGPAASWAGAASLAPWSVAAPCRGASHRPRRHHDRHAASWSRHPERSDDEGEAGRVDDLAPCGAHGVSEGPSPIDLAARSLGQRVVHGVTEWMVDDQVEEGGRPGCRCAPDRPPRPWSSPSLSLRTTDSGSTTPAGSKSTLASQRQGKKCEFPSLFSLRFTAGLWVFTFSFAAVGTNAVE